MIEKLEEIIIMQFPHKQAITISLLVGAACIAMGVVDAIWVPNYFVKSIMKLFLFLLLPIGYARINKEISFSTLFIFKKATIHFPILLGIVVYAFIISCYFVLGPLFDLTNITTSLESSIGVSANNFLFVALYISFVNSFLEEFFFRGFAFLSLKQVSSRKFAYFISAAFFASYHVSMMIGWVNIGLLLLLILSLFIAGLLFNWLNERNGTIYPSWFVHMAANFSINTIGFILFGII